MTLALVLSTLTATLAQDGNWPQFRGPDRSGVSTETGLLKEWPKDGPPLAWKATGIGAGYSTVAVADGKIYTTGDIENDSFLFCLAAADGKLAWKAKIGTAPHKHKSKSWNGVRSTPTVDGTRVYALGEAGDLICVNTTDGKEVWRKHMVADLKGKVGAWDYADGPLIDGANVILKPGGSEGAIAALNKETGAVAWRSTEFKDSAEYTSLYPCEIGGVKQYLALTMEHIAGIGTDGKLLWKAATKRRTAVCSMPIYHDGVVYATSSYGFGGYGYSVTGKGGAFEVKELYGDGNNTFLPNHHGSVVRIGTHLYGTTDKGLECMELKTGKTAWSNRSVGKGSITAADGHLIVRTENAKSGEIALVEASPEGYKEKGRFPMADPAGLPLWSYPVVAGGRLYLRATDVLHCYDVKAK
jgi:outer membrane protein assembly factor BamB